MSYELTFITSHAKKAQELGRYLNYPVQHHKLDLPEIQSLDPIEVSRAKAAEAFRQLQRPVLIEDFSIRFEALGALPGPLVKWFLKELQPEGICRMLDGYSTRQAAAQTCFVLGDESGVHIFDGSAAGTIAEHPRGDHGYGLDAIFVPNGQEKTWGEMNEEEQMIYSLRRIGLEKLEAFLRVER